MTSIDYNTAVRTIDGRDTDLRQWQGKVLLIVNVASRCGFTSQYCELQLLHERFADRGFAVLGFPCNQFAGQEPGGEDEIATFCERNFGVSFPMFAKVLVNGADAHPLFRQLREARRGILGSKALKWNFTKFLVDRQGQVVARFAPRTRPAAIEARIEALLDPETA